MIIRPVNQSSVGDGNVRDNVVVYPNKSLHLVYYNADGSIYTGDDTATLLLFASNEDAFNAVDIKAPVLLASVAMNKTNYSQLFDVLGAYNHLIIRVSAISSGKVSVFLATREG